MDADELRERLRPWFEYYKRPAWRPVVRKGDGPSAASKFSGTPWLAADEPWPACGNCHRPLQLFLQLNLDELPKELGKRYGSGLLQLFYCTNAKQMCAVKCEAWSPFGRSVVARVVQPTGVGAAPHNPHARDFFPAKTIVGWEGFDDYPQGEEQGFIWDGEPLGSRILCPNLDLVLEDLPVKTVEEVLTCCQQGDKLAGWPFWVQGAEYPNCPRCGRRMRYVFQIDSENNLPYMFGDVGCSHITQCPEHQDVVAFGWACC
jgi:uncharacterized protein YwqG